MNPTQNPPKPPTGFWALSVSPASAEPALPPPEDFEGLEDDLRGSLPPECEELFEAFAAPVDPSLLSIPID